MKQKYPLIAVTAAALAAASLVAVGLRAASNADATSVPQPGAADEVTASVTTIRPLHTTVPLTVKAWGDVAPAQAESLSLARAGQVVALPVVVGQRVRKGAVVARLAADPASEASFVNAQTALKLAQGEVQRVHSLFDLQLATVSQLETARKAEKDAQAAVEMLRKTGAGAGESTLTAPCDGVVMTLNAALGDRLAANAPVLQLGRVDLLRINLGIEPSLRFMVHVGDEVDLTALPSGPGAGAAPPVTHGQVTSLQDLVDPKTRLVNAVIQVPTASAGALVLGMRVQGTITTGHADGWLVPRLAVLTDDQGDYLYQVRHGVAQRITVQRRVESSGQVAVDGPLDGSLSVVAMGNYELKDGMKVTEASK